MWAPSPVHSIPSTLENLKPNIRGGAFVLGFGGNAVALLLPLQGFESDRWPDWSLDSWWRGGGRCHKNALIWQRQARGEKLLELAVLSICHHHTLVSGDRCSKDTRYRVWKGIRKRGNNIQMVQQASGTQTTYWWLYHRELVQVKALRAILQYAW